MEIARVKGTVVATRKDTKLNGYKMLLLSPADTAGIEKNGTPIVALDSVDAGIGDLVLVVRGSSARQATNMSVTPVDAMIIGIIDQITISEKTTYNNASVG
jgi:ethanolamine utilization protein EutN